MIVLEKFAVIFVFHVIVPLDGDQLLNVVVYPVAFETVAVTFVPLENVSTLPLTLYVVPYGILTDEILTAFVLTVP